MRTTETVCLHCEVKFEAQNREIARGNAKFCTLSCFHKHNKGKDGKKTAERVTVYCALCDKAVVKIANKTKSKSGLNFCSRKCKDAGQRVDNGLRELWPPHYTEEAGITSYRRFAFSKKESRCEDCGYNKIKDVLQVHHLDEDRRNNKLENLAVLCPTCHEERHYLKHSGRFKHSKQTDS